MKMDAEIGDRLCFVTIIGNASGRNPGGYNANVAQVNNVTRLLDLHEVEYAAFDLPVEKLGALETAALLHVDPAIVFKTIVVTRDGQKQPLLAVVPGNATVDLKLLSAAVGEKKLHLPTEREAEAITGLQAGGISPLALINKGFKVVIDIAAREFDEIHVSGGQRGLNLRLRVEDLARLTKAQFASISNRQLGR